jgi:hypothetical protein
MCLLIEYDKVVFDHWIIYRCDWPLSMTTVCLTIELDKVVFDRWALERCVYSLSMTKVVLDYWVRYRCDWPLSMTTSGQSHLYIIQWSNTTLSYSMSKHIFVMLNGQTHLCHTPVCLTVELDKVVFDRWVLQMCVWPLSMTKLCLTTVYDKGVLDHRVWQMCVWLLS